MAAKAHQRPADEKLREMILYLSEVSAQDPHFGAVKLNKLLFYIDVLSYQEFGRSITGRDYQALPQGPAPKRLAPVMEGLKRTGELRIQRQQRFRFQQLRPVAGRAARNEHFSADWCIPCREMDHSTFADAAVIREAQRFVRLRADLTAQDHKTGAIVNRFKVQGVPTTLLIDSRGRIRQQTVGYVGPAQMLESLRRVD